MNTRGAKIRLSRQLGIAVTPKSGKALERRPHPPGQHGGTKDRLEGSDYKRHLIEKQRLRTQYNIDEKQMRNYVAIMDDDAKAWKTSGLSGSIARNAPGCDCLSLRSCPHNLCRPTVHFPRATFSLTENGWTFLRNGLQ